MTCGSSVSEKETGVVVMCYHVSMVAEQRSMAMEKSISEPNENLMGDLAGTKRSMAVDETLVTTVARRVIDELRRSSQMLSNSVSNLMQISVALNGKSIDLSKVVSMIDETATLLKAEKAHGIDSFGQTEVEDKALALQISAHWTADCMDQLSNTAVVSMPQERIQERIDEETMDVPVSQMMEEAVKPIPHDQVQKRTVEKIVDLPISVRNSGDDPASSGRTNFRSCC